MILRSGSSYSPATYRQGPARSYASSYSSTKTTQPSYTAPKTFHDKKSTAPIQSRLKLWSLPPPPHLSMMKVVSEPPKNNSSTQRSAQGSVQAWSKVSLRSLPPPPHFNDMKVMKYPKSDTSTPNHVTQPVTQDLMMHTSDDELNSSFNSSSWSSDDSRESEELVFKQSRLSRVQPQSKIECKKDVLAEVERCLDPFLSEVRQLVNGLKEENQKKEELKKYQTEAKAAPSLNPFQFHVEKVDQTVKKYELDGRDKANYEITPVHSKQPASIPSTNPFNQNLKKNPNDLEILKFAAHEIINNEIKSISKIDNEINISSWPIPHPCMKEMKGVKFFEVELLEFISPSQFTFQFNVNDLEHMMGEME